MPGGARAIYNGVVEDEVQMKGRKRSSKAQGEEGESKMKKGDNSSVQALEERQAGRKDKKKK